MLQSVERASLSKYIGAALSNLYSAEESVRYVGEKHQFMKHIGPGIRSGNNKKKVSKTHKRTKIKISLQSRRINRNK
jgi:hypothetical protein